MVTIDPRNAPIFGDAVAADPPRPVRVAAVLLLGHVALAAGYGLYTNLDVSPPLFLVPLTLAVWFAVSMRAGRNWARTASTVLSGLFIAMMALLIDYRMADLAAFAVSVTLLLCAMRLMWRGDVREYFGA